MGNAGPAAAIAVCQKEAVQSAAVSADSHGLKTMARTGSLRLGNVNQPTPSLGPRRMTDAKVDTPPLVGR